MEAAGTVISVTGESTAMVKEESTVMVKEDTDDDNDHLVEVTPKKLQLSQILLLL